jgi:hypothetical protein
MSGICVHVSCIQIKLQLKNCSSKFSHSNYLTLKKIGVLYNCIYCLTCLWNLVTLEEKQTRGISLQLHLAEEYNCYRTNSHKGLHMWSVIVPMGACLIGSLSKSNPTYWLYNQFNTSKYRHICNFPVNNMTAYDHSSSHAFFKFSNFSYFALMMRLHYKAQRDRKLQEVTYSPTNLSEDNGKNHKKSLSG